MSESTGTKRLNAVVKELNVGMQTLIDHLAKKGHSVDAKPTTKLSEEQYNLLLSDFQSEKKNKEDSKQLIQNKIIILNNSIFVLTLTDHEFGDFATISIGEIDQSTRHYYCAEHGSQNTKYVYDGKAAHRT